jgi:hypothetical protein
MTKAQLRKQKEKTQRGEKAMLVATKRKEVWYDEEEESIKRQRKADKEAMRKREAWKSSGKGTIVTGARPRRRSILLSESSD